MGGDGVAVSVHDPSFEPDALTGSADWVAMRLGRKAPWLSRNLHLLERDGFPRRDPILRQWIKADVDTWIKMRRQVPDYDVPVESPQEPEINLDAI